MSGKVFDLHRAGRISIAEIDMGKLADINKFVTSIQVSYTMNMASELRFTIVDKDFAMLGKNYFQVGRTVIYTTSTLGTFDAFASQNSKQKLTKNVDQLFEIARLDVSQGPGESPQVSVTCYSKAIQQMKRDKKPQNINGNGTEFVKRAAIKYGLKFSGEKTSKTKKINKATGSKQAESLWQVIERLATDSKFVVFEVDGVLVFGSQKKHLLNKWGTSSDISYKYDKKKKKTLPETQRFVQLLYPSNGYVTKNGKVLNSDFEILSIPSLEYSDNDPYDGKGSLQLSRKNATQLRPGMTIDIKGIPQFSGRYLIDSVSFDDLSPDPVSITFKKPEKQEKDIKQLKVGTKYSQTNQFSMNDKTQTTPYGLLSAKTKKFVPDYARLLSLTLGKTEVSLKPPAKVNPLPTAYDERLYPTAPVKPGSSVIAYGNIDLWSRPVYKDEVGIYPLDAIVTGIYENSASIQVILPGVYVNESGVPTRVADTAEAISRYNSNQLHLGKFSTAVLANAYKQLLDIQQLYIMMDRFPPPTVDIPEHSLYPLPTDSEEQNYPTMVTGLLDAGNIDLYTRPIGQKTVAGKVRKFTTYPAIQTGVTEIGFNNDEQFALVLECLWEIDGKIKLLTKQEAVRKYKEDGLFLAKCDSIVNAQVYASLIIQQQQLISKTRIPGTRLPGIGWYG